MPKKMNPEVKALWLKALRSGRYKQSSGSLKDEQGYCCLGVLCNLYDRRKWKKNSLGSYYYQVGPDDAENSFLPEAVQLWAGLTSHNPHVGDETLARLNDRGNSFKEIADLIEKNL